MKFHLSVIATLLGLTLALALPTFATAGEIIDCRANLDSCTASPDLCNCSGVSALNIYGSPSLYVGASYYASGGRPPYKAEISGGATIGYNNSGVTVASIPACMETVTLTIYDACKQSKSKTVPVLSSLTIDGPEKFAVDAQYTVSGGDGPYTWNTSCGTIGTTTGIVTDAAGCCSVTVTATDFCNKTKTRTVSTANGPLSILGSNNFAVGVHYWASGGNAPYNPLDASAGEIDEASGIVTSVGACSSTVATSGSLTVTDSCGLTAFKYVTIPVGTWVTNSAETGCVSNEQCIAIGGEDMIKNKEYSVPIGNNKIQKWTLWSWPHRCGSISDCDVVTEDLICQ